MAKAKRARKGRKPAGPVIKLSEKERQCRCGQPMDAGWTLTCKYCYRWFHGACVNLEPDQAELVEKAVCTKCAVSHHTESKLRPQCRLHSCGKLQDSSGFCSEAHQAEFWRLAVEFLNSANENNHSEKENNNNNNENNENNNHSENKNNNNENNENNNENKNNENNHNENPSENKEDVEIMRWLSTKFHPNDFVQFRKTGPQSIPAAVPEETAEMRETRQLLADRRAHRDKSGECGFDPQLVGKRGALCETPKAKCRSHAGWPQMVDRRLELALQNDQTRREPDAAYIARRAKTLLMGTTRFSERGTLRAAYMVPYVWRDDDREFFLEGSPHHFWETEF